MAAWDGNRRLHSSDNGNGGGSSGGGASGGDVHPDVLTVVNNLAGESLWCVYLFFIYISLQIT